MSIDNAIMEEVSKGRSDPTIRFYRWKPSSVFIGRFQSMQDEVNTKLCDETGITYVRRITGGGAVYHDNSGEITYSVIAPEEIIPKGIIDSYRLVCGWIIYGLSKLGIKAEFSPINDVTVNERKISGNAQTRKDGVVLQHGTILYDVDFKTMFSVLNIPAEKISDKMIKSAEERVTRVSEFSGITLDMLYSSLFEGFVSGKEYELGSLNVNETVRAAELADTVYRTKEWNFNR